MSRINVGDKLTCVKITNTSIWFTGAEDSTMELAISPGESCIECIRADGADIHILHGVVMPEIDAVYTVVQVQPTILEGIVRYPFMGNGGHNGLDAALWSAGFDDRKIDANILYRVWEDLFARCTTSSQYEWAINIIINEMNTAISWKQTGDLLLSIRIALTAQLLMPNNEAQIFICLVRKGSLPSNTFVKAGDDKLLHAYVGYTPLLEWLRSNAKSAFD